MTPYLLLLIAWGSPGPAQDQGPSLYQQVISVTTGKNGYEEYVRAADLVNNTQALMLGSWSPTMGEATIDPKATPQERAAQALQVKTWNEVRALNYIQGRRQFASQFSKAVDLVRQGNLKPVFDPRAESSQKAAPELTQFKLLVKLIVSDAYIKFSDGAIATGTDDLLTCLTFGRKVSHGSILGSFVSTAMNQMTLGGFERHFESMSLKDCERIVANAEEALADIPVAIAPIEKERSLMTSRIDSSLSNPETYFEGVDTTELSAIKRASGAQKESWKHKVATISSGVFDRLLALATRPEREWVDVDTIAGEGAFEGEEPVVKLFLSTTFNPFRQLFTSAARERTQLRLLDLHGRVLSYRWENGVLPGALADAVPAELIKDPLTGDVFHYERDGAEYRLYSTGSAATGEIQVRYRLPANTDTKPLPPLQAWSAR